MLLRAGLTLVLAQGGFEVLDAAGDADELISHTREHHPDLVVTDIRMPPTSTDEGCVRRSRSGGNCPTSGSSCSLST